MARLNYKHLRYFWAVAHEGNLTRAAEQMAVSQSALSTQIRKLEEQVGEPLFERRGRQLLLMEAGQIALDHADAIFATGEELLSTLAHRSSPQRHVLRVGSLATLSRNFQIQFLRPVLGRSNTEIVIRSGSLAELLPSLEAHQLDVVLANTVPPRDAATAFISHPIAEQPVSLVGTPSRVGKPTSVEHLLAREPLVLPTLASSIRTGFDG